MKFNLRYVDYYWDEDTMLVQWMQCASSPQMFRCDRNVVAVTSLTHFLLFQAHTTVLYATVIAVVVLIPFLQSLQAICC